MTYALPFSRPTMPHPHPNSSVPWVIIALFAIIILLELVSLADYVFSYLYIGPILLANLRLNRRIAVGLTLLASIMTLVNLWVPGSHIITASTIANRLIAVVALAVTEVLGNRNRYYQEAIAQQQAKLQFQEKLASLREDFVSTLTHDLKTPLLGAIETLKALQQEQFGRLEREQQRVLAIMVRSHQASLQLVEMVLDIYRNDADGVELLRSPVNLAVLAEQVIHTLSDLASSYQVSIHLRHRQPDHPHYWVNGDTLQLQRVFSNLVSNAINHSPIDGTVEIILESQVGANQEQHIVKVMDEGPGIRSDDLPQLFERFYQGQSDRQAKGAGLGLYLSRQIIEAHGGTIWAENRVPRGACFSFFIPASIVQPC